MNILNKRRKRNKQRIIQRCLMSYKFMPKTPIYKHTIFFTFDHYVLIKKLTSKRYRLTKFLVVFDLFISHINVNTYISFLTQFHKQQHAVNNTSFQFCASKIYMFNSFFFAACTYKT